MTAEKLSQRCENDLHYTCSGTNCNLTQQNTAPINGTACLQQSIRFKKRSSSAMIVRVALSLAFAILLVGMATLLTGCGRESGKFPNIPEVMDECGSWSGEEFASKMNLERDAGLSGGSEVTPPNWAKDLTSVVGNDDLVTMFLSNNVVTIYIGADMSDVTYSTTYQALAAMRNYIRYDFDYRDAIEILDLVGIKENSIKVYDDASSEGQGSSYQTQYSVSWMYAKEYEMCGETETKDGSSLYFSLSAQAGFNYSSSPNGAEIGPFDAVVMKFTTTKPFDLSEES